MRLGGRETLLGRESISGSSRLRSCVTLTIDANGREPRHPTVPVTTQTAKDRVHGRLVAANIRASIDFMLDEPIASSTPNSDAKTLGNRDGP